MKKIADIEPGVRQRPRARTLARGHLRLVPLPLPEGFASQIVLQSTPVLTQVVSELTPAEQVVIWALRQWLSGETGERLVRQELFNLCRLSAIEAAIQGLETLVDLLGKSGRRVLVLHCCRCREVSHDERHLLRLIAAAQRPEKALTRALALWLVPRDLIDALISAAQGFGQALEQGGLELPLALPGGETVRA